MTPASGRTRLPGFLRRSCQALAALAIAVSALAGQSPATPVTFKGVYSNLDNGLDTPLRPMIGLELFQEGDRWFGTLTTSDNLGGDGAPLEEITCDPSSGHLSFAALVLGGQSGSVSKGIYVQGEGVLSEQGILLRVTKRSFPDEDGSSQDVGGWQPDWSQATVQWVPRRSVPEPFPGSYLAWRLAFPQPALSAVEDPATQTPPLGPAPPSAPAEPSAPKANLSPGLHLLGAFSTLQYEEETGDVVGAEVTLYQEGDHVFGSFVDAEGEPRSAPLERLTFNPATGWISFQAWVFGGVADDPRWPGIPIPCMAVHIASGFIRADGLHVSERSVLFDQARGAGVNGNLGPDPSTEEFLPRIDSGAAQALPASFLDWRRSAGYSWFTDHLPAPQLPVASTPFGAPSFAPSGLKPSTATARDQDAAWEAWIQGTYWRLRYLSTLLAILFGAIGWVMFAVTRRRGDWFGMLCSVGLLFTAVTFTRPTLVMAFLGGLLCFALFFRRGEAFPAS